MVATTRLLVAFQAPLSFASFCVESEGTSAVWRGEKKAESLEE